MQQDQVENHDVGAAWSGVQFARRGLALSERRRDDLIELYRSGRWRRYYSEMQFLSVMRRAKAEVEAWAALAGPVAEPLARTG